MTDSPLGNHTINCSMEEHSCAVCSCCSAGIMPSAPPSKGKFLYSIQSSGPFEALYTLLPRQICSLRHHRGFSGKHPAITTTNARRLLIHIRYPQLSIARYSFIQLSELEQCRVKKLAQGFNTAAQDSNPGSRSRVRSSTMSHCAHAH